MNNGITKFNSPATAQNKRFYQERVDFQANFLITGGTYAQYKHYCDLKHTDPDLQKIFNATGLNQDSEMRVIFNYLFNQGMRLKDIVKSFKFHKAAIIQGMPKTQVYINDNILMTMPMEQNMYELLNLKFQMAVQKAKFDKELSKIQEKINQKSKEIEEELMSFEQKDIEMSFGDVNIKKKMGWKTAGNKLKVALPISKVEETFGKDNVIMNQDKLGLEYGQYVQIDTQWHDRKVREELKKGDK